MGAAITATVATCAYKNFEEACNTVVRLKDRGILLNKNVQSKHNETYEIFKQLCKKMKFYIKNLTK